MNLHEYQAKQLLKEYQVIIPEGSVAVSAQEAVAIARKLSGPWVIKAQVHAGGRGKAGGVQIVEDPNQIEQKAKTILSKELITQQSGSGGRKVRKLLIEEKVRIRKEFYLALTVDRERAVICVLASRHGGMEIEEVIQKHPGELLVEPVSAPRDDLAGQARRITERFGVGREEADSLGILLGQLARLYQEKELSLLEINPLVLGSVGKEDRLQWIALDAKMSVDDNALFRHPELESLRDLDEEDAREIEAARYGLSYVRLEGSIGCMVNGAGLAMATLDEIKNHGLDPANFLDIGGGANSERVAKAIEIITSDERVKVILINIFGGITLCDQVAQGIIDALKGKKRLLPMIVRLEGTRVEEGKKLLKSTSLPMTPVANLSEAAKKIKGILGRKF